ncbi:MAG: UDP-N-acetylmuramyl-tripeptide synthetase [Candidatus Liptonbacteria bacterium]|nr:UDP-N-acetylmuramyl-tripeptide synthetase [Candidatus Liptonbacteria bacterium]
MRRILYRVPGLVFSYHFALSLLGALFFGFPSRKLHVIGVTGTKGKTTVLELMDAVLSAAGKKTALLSSLRVKIGDREEKNTSENTMPGRFFIQRFLRRAVREGCRYALLEVTSQGVAQHRHRFINWSAAFLINIHPEHIEAHGSYEKYRAAKLEFLKYAVSKGAEIFINRDDRESEFFTRALRGAHLALYSKDESLAARLGAASRDIKRGAREKPSEFYSADFNRENAAAAASLAANLGIDDRTVLRALGGFEGLPGRVEFIPAFVKTSAGKQQEPFTVVIDYAHTPDSLRAVYAALRGQMTNDKLPMTNSHESSVVSHKLICVLGSAGGGRDKWKRPEMGRIAASYCDAIVFTDEDPYDENPESIVADIENGARENPRFQSAQLASMTWRILDRREAIRTAVSIAVAGDIVVVTGKGSESWIHLAGGRKIPWSEKETVETILRENKTAP